MSINYTFAAAVLVGSLSATAVQAQTAQPGQLSVEADPQTPPDVTLLCTSTADGFPTNHKLVEVWYKAGVAVFDHGKAWPAKIDSRSIKIVQNFSGQGYSEQVVDVIDRTTGFFSSSGTTTGGRGSIVPESGQCSKAPSKPLF